MNAVDYGLDQILEQVPKELLRAAFDEDRPFIGQIVSLDEVIRRDIVQSKVIRDLNLVSGRTHEVDLSKCQSVWMDHGVKIVIPRSLTNHMPIIQPLTIETQFSGQGRGDPYLRAASGTAEVYLVGTDTIFTPHNLSWPAVLRCVIGMDENMTNVSTRMLPLFGDLCVLKAKAMIYTKLAVSISSGQLGAGRVDGRIRQMVDSYADSQELYAALRTKCSKTHAMGDRNYERYFIRTTMGKK